MARKKELDKQCCVRIAKTDYDKFEELYPRMFSHIVRKLVKKMIYEPIKNNIEEVLK